MDSAARHLVAQNEYGRYCIPFESQHRPTAQTLLAGDVWEPETTAVIAARGRLGDIVTAGAYFGDMLPAAAAGGHTVYTAEPNPVNFAAARATLALNGIENVVLFEAAFGAQTGHAVIEVADASGVPHGGGSWLTSQLRRPRRRGVRIVCNVTTIDEIVPTDTRRIALVHLDVEGYETQALRGAMKTIERCLPDLILESQPRLGRIARRLSSLGYREVAELEANVQLSATA